MKLKLLSIAVSTALLAACQTMPEGNSGASTSAVTGLRAASNDYLTNPGSTSDLPPAKVGECYARVVTPAVFEDVQERVLKRAASSSVEIVPAQYQAGTESVLVRAASKRLEVVPAVFEDVQERVLVKPAGKRLDTVPATYKTVTERRLVKPAYTVWKRSSELTAAERALQNIDPNAGDILCLVEVPAQYENVSSQVIDQAARTVEVDVPAEYATVTKSVVKTPARTVEVDVPAEYKTVAVSKLVAAPREVKRDIPAEYDTVTKRVVKSQGSSEWRQIVCETNATPAKLAEIQGALKKAGFDTGRNDGVIDAGTLAAVRGYQRSKNLPIDGDRYINVATVRSLGVSER